MGLQTEMRCVGALLVLAFASGASGQADVHSVAGLEPGAGPSASSVVPVRARSAQVVRAIDDAATGSRWVLVRDGRHPGGPGHLILAGSFPAQDVRNESGPAVVSGSTEPYPALPPPVIRAGDRLIVEENTPVVEARLQALALGAAAPGSAFPARLEIGGKVVRVVALGPGRAALAAQTGVRP
jgi:hypothetical protein